MHFGSFLESCRMVFVFVCLMNIHPCLGEFQKKKATLQEQLANLKKEAEQRSKVCDYIRKDSTEGK